MKKQFLEEMNKAHPLLSERDSERIFKQLPGWALESLTIEQLLDLAALWLKGNTEGYYDGRMDI